MDIDLTIKLMLDEATVNNNCEFEKCYVVQNIIETSWLNTFQQIHEKIIEKHQPKNVANEMKISLLLMEYQGILLNEIYIAKRRVTVNNNSVAISVCCRKNLLTRW